MGFTGGPAPNQRPGVGKAGLGPRQHHPEWLEDVCLAPGLDGANSRAREEALFMLKPQGEAEA